MGAVSCFAKATADKGEQLSPLSPCLFHEPENRVHAEARRRNLIFDRIYRMNRIREMNGLNSVAKGMVYSETLCDAAKLRLISWDSRGPTV
jgi:hypothetical protein